MNDNTINNDMTMGGATGTLLAGRYRVVRQLGQGGMGSVWLAEDVKLDGHKVAIKMLPSVLVNNKRAYAQVKQEALVSLKLSHPNIATVRAFEEESGSPFLVMDYIDGRTLDDYLAEKGKLTEEETIRLLKPVAAALDYAHAQGVVHRDVKPGNVMVTWDGDPYVLDFGIAREIQETMTRVTGKLSSGTLLYMSPEQLNGDAPKPAQDVYSFAAMAYECLKGEPPFSRGGVEDQIKHKTPEPLGPQFIKCGLGVMAGLAKSPEGRPECCAVVLEKVGKKSAKTSTGVFASKIRIAVVGALLVLAALAGIGGWFGWSAYCRAETDRLAAIKAEMGRKAAWRRLELETDRLASQVDEAQRVSVREQFAKREGLAVKVKELEDAAKSGQLAFSATNLVAATNWFHVALDCSDWLSSNAVLHAQCMQAAKAALNARKAADEADAKNLASNEYGRAVIAFGKADEGLKAARFEESRRRWMKAAGLFEEAERIADARRKAETDRVAKKVADMRRAFDEMRFDDIVRDPESERIPELRFLKGLIYENGLGGVMPDMKRAVSLYGGTTGVCALAEVHLAEMRLSGDYLEKDKSVSVTNRIVACMSRIRELADAGDSNAMYALFSAYDDGIGVAKNRRTGKRWLEDAVRKGNVLAKFYLGVKCYFGDTNAEYEKDECYCMDRELYQRLFQGIRSGGWWAVNFASSQMYELEGNSAAASSEMAKCLPQIRSLAEQGVASAQNELGDCLLNGRGADKNEKEALRWYRQAAEKGRADAQAWVAMFYLAGKFCDKDCVKAHEMLRESAAKGSQDAWSFLGLCYEDGLGVERDYRKAFEWFQKSANSGRCEAMVHVGNYYRFGLGVATNKQEAIRWYRKAAKIGYLDAQNGLGVMLWDGEGCEEDAVEAVQWFRKAAERGHGWAMYNLGKAYDTGNGVALDKYEAFRWMRKAAEKDISDAQNRLGVMYANGDGCLKNAEEAFKWYHKAAERGCDWAMYNLAIAYRDGEGVTVDKSEAFQWMRKAADKDIPDAQAMLGWMYEDGVGVARNYSKARELYEKAAKKNNSVAENNLGVMYMDGKGVARNDVTARIWLIASMHHGNSKAPLNLGDLYRDGRGGPKNISEARRLYLLAKERGDDEAEYRLKALGR